MLFQLLRKEQPDILHNVALKPVLYGSLAARISGTRGIVNAIAGLGHLFAVSERATTLRSLVKLAFRWLLRGHGKVIVQNPDDLRVLESIGAILPGQATLIRGSGVDLSLFIPSPEAPGTPIVLFAARLLWDKGIQEFVDAAKELKKSGIEARFVIVGKPDPENHTSVTYEDLLQWTAEGSIEWWGHRTEMTEVFACSQIFCLPSYYGEGVPKVLLEAAAAGLPLITTDMPGCREVVDEGLNGFLVQPRDAKALASKVMQLLGDDRLRMKMGAASRLRAEHEFGIESVNLRTIDIYKDMLRSK